MATATIKSITGFCAAHAELEALRQDLNNQTFEMSTEIDVMLMAIISRQHVFMFGEPGVGKSMLANLVGKACGMNYVAKLLSKVSTYEDVFGTIKVSGIMEDRYERIAEGYAQTAELLFLDEIWKSNAAVLQSLLTIVNERFFDDNGNRISVPLQTMVCASNELPEDSSLAALYDRIMFRLDVKKIRNRDNQMKLVMGHVPTLSTSLDPRDLATLRDAADQVNLSPIADAFIDIVNELRREGFTISDRRMGQIAKAVRASAILHGRLTANESDLLVLQHCAWDEPTEAPRVAGIVSSIAMPKLGEALELLDAAIEQYSGLDLGSITNESIASTSRINREMKRIATEIERLGMDNDEIAEVHGRVASMQHEIAESINKALML